MNVKIITFKSIFNIYISRQIKNQDALIELPKIIKSNKFII